jgi:SAM-dependent methyltransferase
MSATNWHDDDGFWAAMQDWLFDEAREQAATPQVAWIAQLLELRPGAKVLDLPCGTGRHSIAMAKLGMNVTAIDRMASYLDRGRDAERRARESSPSDAWGPAINWIHADMRSANVPPGTVSVVTNLWTSFGYFETWEENAAVLRTIRAALCEGGHLVMELAGKEALALRFQERRWSELPDGRLLLENVQVTENWSRMRTRWILISPEGTRREHVTQLWVYSARELCELLREAGFGECRVFGSLAGEPFDAKAKRLVVVARA